MSKNKYTGFFAFLLGGLTGAAIALLYAPRSGEKTRQMLSDEGQEMMNKARASVQDVQDTASATMQQAQTRLESLNNKAKDRLEKLQEIASSTFKEGKENLEKASAKAKEVIAE